MVRSIDHINSVVADLERSVAFYTEILGMEETRRAHLQGDWIDAIVGLKGVEAEVVYVQPRGGGPRLELLHYRTPEGEALPANALPNTQGLRHLAFQVEDIDAMVTELRAHGIEPLSDPVAVPSTIKHDAGSKRLCYFRDPDGVILELAEYNS